MNMKLMRRKLSYIFCFVLIVAMALVTSGCNEKATQGSTDAVTEATGSSTDAVTETPQGSTDAVAEATQEADAAGDAQAADEPEVLGQGSTVFYFNVTDPEGAESFFEIHTDHTTVGDALQELGLIEGEEGEFGLYVKTVNGVTVDDDTSGMYWAFYEGEEYASAGVDSTEIVEGAEYSFKAQK